MTSQEKFIIKSFFDDELNLCKSAIQINTDEKNQVMVNDWKRFESAVNRMKTNLFQQLKIK